MDLHWFKCKGGVWCGLKTLNLDTVDEEGVYIIWHASNPSEVVYVGQGDVADRISKHRNNNEITEYESAGKLHVTWATVPAHQRDGVERYLADKLNPLVGDVHPQATPISVNLPW